MNLNQLIYFSTLAKTEHFTHASKILYISQPTLTHAIKELERELNVSLFDKDGRNVKINKCGRIFLQYVNEALKELEEGKKQLQMLVDPKQGTINLGFLPSLAQKFIPTLLDEFVESNSSQIKFNLSQGTTEEITENLISGKIDLSFSSQINHKNINSVPIIKQVLYLITPPNHPLAKKQSIDFKEIENSPFILYKKSSGLRPVIDNIFTKIGISPHVAFELEDDHAVCGFVSNGLGIAIVPQIYGIEKYNIAMLKVPQNLYNRYIYINFVSNRFMSPTIKYFKDYVLEKYKTIYQANNT